MTKPRTLLGLLAILAAVTALTLTAATPLAQADPVMPGVPADPVEIVGPNPDPDPGCRDRCAVDLELAIQAAVAARQAANAAATQKRDDEIRDARNAYLARLLLCDGDTACQLLALLEQNSRIDNARDTWREEIAANNAAYNQAYQAALDAYDLCIFACDLLNPGGSQTNP